MIRQKSKSVLAVLLFAGIFLISSQVVYAEIVDFDSISATGYYADVTPNTGRGPFLSFPGVTFNGGVVMSNAGWSNLATTPPNLYGTSDFYPLADGSLLPGKITGTFTVPSDGLSLDVINGLSAANITVSVYDASNAFLGSSSFDLAAYPTNPGAVGHLSLSEDDIAYFIVTSNQSPGSIDFAIDTVEFTSVPEPTTMLLLGSGLLGLAGYGRKKFLKR